MEFHCVGVYLQLLLGEWWDQTVTKIHCCGCTFGTSNRQLLCWLNGGTVVGQLPWWQMILCWGIYIAEWWSFFHQMVTVTKEAIEIEFHRILIANCYVAWIGRLTVVGQLMPWWQRILFRFFHFSSMLSTQGSKITAASSVTLSITFAIVPLISLHELLYWYHLSIVSNDSGHEKQFSPGLFELSCLFT